ncbi:hypothetical protein MMC28_008292 [Mycoblastus sanguinarius]|nr:hypothetical protein [Mycoblastus sanguinarius]
MGRSYGVGSPAGLVDENLYGGSSSANLLSYKYNEPGYLAHVTCFYNTSSDFHLEEIQAGKPDNGIPYVYYAIGHFPNAISTQGQDFFSVVGLDGDDSIAVVAAKRYQARNVILVTAGSDYPHLNNTQCEVRFAPTMFTVGVDISNKLISVLPINTTKTAGPASPSFDSTAGLAGTAINQINDLGMVSTSLYISIVGDALMSNITTTTTTSSFDPSIALAAMADSFSVMLDEVLLFVGSSQFFLPNTSAGDFSTVNAHLNVKVVRLGEAKYVFATFAICVVLLAAVAAEACRTKIWSRLPRWDYMDTTCLVLASAVAGEDVVGEMCRGREGGQMEWTGGGPGSWGQGRTHTAREGWDGSGQEEVPEVRLQLGKKVLKAAPAQQGRDKDEDGDAKGRQEVQITAVSLSTSGAKGVVSLI